MTSKKNKALWQEFVTASIKANETDAEFALADDKLKVVLEQSMQAQHVRNTALDNHLAALRAVDAAKAAYLMVAPKSECIAVKVGNQIECFAGNA